MTQPQDEIDPVLSLVAAAGRVARHVQHDLENIRQITKDDRSPVTVADYAVQALVALGLEDHLGEHHIVGEESADALRADDQDAIRRAVVDAVRHERPGATIEQVLYAIDRCDHDASSDSYWTLDPIDGTKGFLRGQQYAIALARIDRGEVTLGVMGCPNLPADQRSPLDEADDHGTLYLARAGGGAWSIHPDTCETIGRIAAGAYVSGQPIRSCGSVEKAHSKASDTQRILEELAVEATPVKLDSQCKYAVVARDQADAYFRMPTLAGYVEKIWDHAAGSLIATEAGALVSDITGRPLDFSQGAQLEANRGVICAVPGLHERIIASIAALGIAAPSA